MKRRYISSKIDKCKNYERIDIICSVHLKSNYVYIIAVLWFQFIETADNNLLKTKHFW